MFVKQVCKQKNIATAIPSSIGCSQITSDSISHFSFVF